MLLPCFVGIAALGAGSDAALLTDTCSDEAPLGDSVSGESESCFLQGVVRHAPSLGREGLLNRNAHQNSHTCFVIATSLGDPEYDARFGAVSDTWGSLHLPGTTVYYMVDASTDLTLVPPKVRVEQVVMAPLLTEAHFFGADYDHLSFRTHSTLRHLDDQKNTEFSHCAWFAVVDDDAYVNMAVVNGRLRLLNAEHPWYLGARGVVSSRSGPQDFVHGAFKIFSRTGLATTRRVADACGLGHRRGFEDVNLGSCLRMAAKAGDESALSTFNFGFHYHDNRRGAGDSNVLEQWDATIANQSDYKSELDAVDFKACLDFMHKLQPSQMAIAHKRVLSYGHCSPAAIRQSTVYFMRKAALLG